MIKVITFVRTSTTRQEIEAQKAENIAEILKLGYKEEEIHTIVTQGASAIKKDEKYKEMMKELDEWLENPNIELVYVWELSRLARWDDVLIAYKNQFIHKKIQLCCKTPSIKLLKDDGMVDTGQELAFTLFSSLVKQEMELKQERFKRAKNALKANKKYIGGKIPYGYMVNERNEIVIKEDDATLLRMYVEKYLNTNLSQTQLAHELREQGYNVNYATLSKWLNNRSYFGIGLEQYPPIFPEETYHAIQEKNRSNNYVLDKAQQRYYFATKMLVCPECGSHLMANLGSGSYYCRNTTKMRHYKCGWKKTMNINAMESIVWYFAHMAHSAFCALEKDDQQKLYNEKIEELKNKIDHDYHLIHTQFEVERERLYYAFKRGRISKKKYDEQYYQLEAKNEENKHKLEYHKGELKHYEELLEALDGMENDWLEDALKMLEENNEYTIQMMYELTHKYIKSVGIEEVGKEYKLTFHFFTNDEQIEVYFNPQTRKDLTMRFYTIDEDDEIFEGLHVEGGEKIPLPVAHLNRFERRRKK